MSTCNTTIDVDVDLAYLKMISHTSDNCKVSLQYVFLYGFVELTVTHITSHTFDNTRHCEPCCCCCSSPSVSAHNLKKKKYLVSKDIGMINKRDTFSELGPSL